MLRENCTKEQNEARRRISRLVHELRLRNREEEEAIKGKQPVVYFHSGAAWDAGDLSGGFW
jgi:hypothetical protein